MPRRGRHRNRDNHWFDEHYYEHWLGYYPHTEAEREEADREIAVLEELQALNMEDAFYNMNNVHAAEQKAALARMTLPHEGISLKEEIIAASGHPKKIEKELERQGATLNTATAEQMNTALSMVQEGGPTVKGVGQGPKPTRRQNRNLRYRYPRITMRKHWGPRNIRGGPQFQLGPEFGEHQRLLERRAELEARLAAIRRGEGGGRRRKTRRTRRKN